MSLTIYYQLMMLTNGDILGSAPEKAVENRMALIRQVFPDLPEHHQKIFEITEFADLRRQVAKPLGAMSDAMLDDITARCAQTLKIQRLNAKIQTAHRKASGEKQPPPPIDDDMNWGPF